MTTENGPDDLSNLPLEPRPDDLEALYRECRGKLVTANRSRSSLKGHDARRQALITELQKQLNDLEVSLKEEASSRMRVHQLNARVAELVRDLETGLDEAAAIIEERGEAGLTTWVVRVARLLPVALRLREVKAGALRLLGRDAEVLDISLQSSLQTSEQAPALLIANDSEEYSEQLQLRLPPLETTPQTPSPPSLTAQADVPPLNLYREKNFGPLILKDLTDAYGLLLLHIDGQTLPEGWCVQNDSLWLPGKALMALESPEDPNDAPVEAALEAIGEGSSVMPELQPWLDVGILPFANDDQTRQLRLLSLDAISSATHVLVSQQNASRFEDVEASPLSLDLNDEQWLGFAINYAEEQELLRTFLQRPGQALSSAPRLSNRGGVRMPDGQGYLATGLGLPLLGIPQAIEPTLVQLILLDGSVLSYQPLQADEEDSTRRLFQPSQQDRRRPALPQGPARFVVSEESAPGMERLIELTALPLHVNFRRGSALSFREDWGLSLGPLELPRKSHDGKPANEDSLLWARHRLNQGDLMVNPLFEQQMLESLCALFQRRVSIQRIDFFKLYGQLRNKPDEWPGFPEAVLRGWCEGGWIEEGLERGKGRWRIQPVDPRLVIVGDNAAQLVGLQTARGLVDLLALAHQLGLRVQSVPPTCPDMPRGWRFFGNADLLASCSGLPLVKQAEWVPDPRQHSWIIEAPLPSDSPPWPTGINTRRVNDAVCGRRGLDQHWKPKTNFPERGRAPISQTIQAETSQYGKRRWHSHDPINGSRFTSCHRNRVALHSLIVATDGLWPFGFTDTETGQLDRLYDAEAYLPLPLSRYAALTGSKMPGPTRHRPQDHTYRYHLDLNFRLYLADTRILPLTSITSSP
jgi:hypothetical protein